MIQTTSGKQNFNGNGTTGPFSFTFPYEDVSHIFVTRIVATVRTPLVVNVDYTLTPAPPGQAGGAVTLTVALAVGTQMEIARVMPLTQLTSFIEFGEYLASTHEKAFDRLTMLIQQLGDVGASAVVYFAQSSTTASYLASGFTATGTDTYSCSNLPTPGAGNVFAVEFTNANTGTAPTLNTIVIKKEGNAALVAGDIPAGHEALLEYNGVNFVLMNPAKPTLAAAQVLYAGVAGGVVDAWTYTVPVSLTTQPVFILEMGAANTLVAPTLNGKTIVKGSNQALAVGDIQGANSRSIFAWDVSLDKYVLLNPYYSATPPGSGQLDVYLFSTGGGGGNDAWQNMPAALTEMYGSNYWRAKANLTNFTQVRLVGYVRTAGAAAAEIRLQYSTDQVTWNYLDAAAGPAISIASTGLVVGAAVNLTGPAKADVFLRLIGINGNGVADPVIYNVRAQFS